jgi:hypothetical protein
MITYFMPDGRIDLEAVSKASKHDLRLLIRGALAPEPGDYVSLLPEGEFPHLLLGMLYRVLPSLAREDFQQVVLEFLGELSRSDYEGHWWGDSGDELIMLVEDIFGESSRKDEVISIILEFVGADRSKERSEPDLRLRALGALLGLGYRGTREFWELQHKRSGETYAVSVFLGLARLNPGTAFSWLISINDEVAARLIIENLPEIVQDYGLARVVSLLDPIAPRFSQRVRDAIASVAEYEGFSLELFSTPLGSRVVPFDDFDCGTFLMRILVGEIEFDVAPYEIGPFLRAQVDSASFSELRRDAVYKAIDSMTERLGHEDWKDRNFVVRLLSVLGAFPSTKSFVTVVSFLDACLKTEVEERQVFFASQALSSLAKMGAIAKQFAAAGTAEQLTVWRAYTSCMVKALDFPGLAYTAYSLLLESRPEWDMLVEATRKLLVRGTVTPVTCFVKLQEVCDVITVGGILGAALRSEIEQGGWPIDVARDLYRISPDIIETRAGLAPEIVTAIEEDIVPRVIQEGAEELAELLACVGD